MALWLERVPFRSEAPESEDYMMKDNGLCNAPIKTSGHQ